MKIEIHLCDKGKEKKIFVGDYSYSEGQSRQEGKPSFFISVNSDTRDYEIHFYADKKEEIDEFIKELQKIVNDFF